MSGLVDLLTSNLGGSALEQLSGQIGADRDATQKAVAAAIPILVGGLARNAVKSPEGAASLASALERDHDGSVLENLGGLLGQLQGPNAGGGLGSLAGIAGSLLGGSPRASKAVDGDGILGHILGGRKPAVEQGVAKASGLDAQKVAALLPVLAPIVMSALGKMKRDKNLNAGELAGMLQGEAQNLAPASTGSAGALLDLLDADNDGQVVDDLVNLGRKGILSKLFGK